MEDVRIKPVERFCGGAGNAGSAMENKVETFNIGVTDIARSWQFGQKRSIDLTSLALKHRWLSVLSRRVEKKGWQSLGPTAAAGTTGRAS